MHRPLIRLLPFLVVLALAVAACGDPGDADGPALGDGIDPSIESGTEDGVADDTADDSDADPDADPDAEPDAGPSDDSAVGQDAVIAVVATVAPVADLVAQVGGDRVEVTSLVPAGADAHTYEPRPQDVVALSEADGYLGIGFGLNDGALALARENLPDGAEVYLLGEQALHDADLVFDHVHDREDAGHTHDGQDVGHTHDDEAGPNPHVWTSLRNTMALVPAIAEALSDLDPAGAGEYAANAAAYGEELAALDTAVRDAAVTIPPDSRTLVSYHDAWAYFARDYDLDYATAVQPADFSEPSAAEVRAVIDLIRDLEVPVVFGSDVFPTPVLETIAEETGAQYLANLSDDVLPGQPGDAAHSYLELMRRNAHTIIDGLGGDASQLQ